MTTNETRKAKEGTYSPREKDENYDIHGIIYDKKLKTSFLPRHQTQADHSFYTHYDKDR